MANPELLCEPIATPNPRNGHTPNRTTRPDWRADVPTGATLMLYNKLDLFDGLFATSTLDTCDRRGWWQRWRWHWCWPAGLDGWLAFHIHIGNSRSVCPARVSVECNLALLLYLYLFQWLSATASVSACGWVYVCSTRWSTGIGLNLEPSALAPQQHIRVRSQCLGRVHSFVAIDTYVYMCIICEAMWPKSSIIITESDHDARAHIVIQPCGTGRRMGIGKLRVNHRVVQFVLQYY